MESQPHTQLSFLTFTAIRVPPHALSTVYSAGRLQSKRSRTSTVTCVNGTSQPRTSHTCNGCAIRRTTKSGKLRGWFWRWLAQSRASASGWVGSPGTDRTYWRSLCSVVFSMALWETGIATRLWTRRYVRYLPIGAFRSERPRDADGMRPVRRTKSASHSSAAHTGLLLASSLSLEFRQCGEWARLQLERPGRRLPAVHACRCNT